MGNQMDFDTGVAVQYKHILKFSHYSLAKEN